MTEKRTGENQEEAGFKRELKLLDSTMLVVGSMIGSGIFIVSADMARTLGSGGYLLLAWLITGAVTVIGALSYGELAGMMPHAGGQYVYLREAYNPLTAFLYGWTLFLVIQTGTISAVAVAFAKFTAVLLPGLSEKIVLFKLGPWALHPSQLVAIATIFILTFINTRGLHGGKLIQDVFTITKVSALAGLILVGIGFAAVNGLPADFSLFREPAFTSLAPGGAVLSVEPLLGAMVLAMLGVSMVGSLFSSDAWNNITFTAGEVVNPKRNIPLSLAIGTLIVTVIYILANVAYLLLLPVSGSPGAETIAGRGIAFAADDRVATAAASVIFGPHGAAVMAVLIMIATFGCNNGLILAGARVYYAMARDGLFFSRVGTLNGRAVPAWALWLQAVWCSALCLSGTYGDLLDYVVFAVLVFYILTVGGLFVLRRKRPEAERPYRAFGYPVLPAVYMLAAAAISVDLLIFRPKFTWPGLIIVLLGIPVYFLWKRFARRS